MDVARRHSPVVVWGVVVGPWCRLLSLVPRSPQHCSHCRAMCVMILCVKWRVRSRRGCHTVGVDIVWRGNGRQEPPPLFSGVHNL